VKKALAILFLVTYIFSTTEMYQLLKLPVLAAHFFEHKAKNSEISIWHFLVLHYDGNHLENHPYNDDYEQDQKLPFMAHANIPNYCFVHAPSFQFEIKNKLYQYLKRKTRVFDENYINNDFFSSIWQPPKSC
jgi:hypothetical protein